MNDLENLNKLLTHLPYHQFRAFIHQNFDLSLENLEEEKSVRAQRQKTRTALVALPIDKRLLMEDVAEKIVLLSDGPGQDVLDGFRQCLFTEAERAEVEALSNQYQRAIWFYENAPDSFKEALDARQADVFRQSQACYSGYKVPSDLKVLLDDDVAMTAFHEQIAADLNCKLDAVAIQIFTRLRPDANTGEEVTLYQISIHNNRLPESIDCVEASELVTRDVIRAESSFITYEPSNGHLEVLSRNSSGREALARLVADAFLQSPITGEKIPLKQYDYQSLAATKIFDIGGENVSSVKVVQLGYEVNNRELMFRIPSNDNETIYVAARAMIHSEFDFRQHTLTYARISIRLKKTATEKARSLSIVLRQDNKCNVKTKREKDRALCDRLLVKWGLIKEVGHDAHDAIAA